MDRRIPLFHSLLPSLTDEETILENVPNLSDVNFMAEILSELGAEVRRINLKFWSIRLFRLFTTPYELVRKMRASICLLRPIVARLGRAEIPMPGGCVIGNRPMIFIFEQDLGVMSSSEGIVKVDAKKSPEIPFSLVAEMVVLLQEPPMRL